MKYKEEELSELCVCAKGELCEVVDFGNDKVKYIVNGITDHTVFGMYFSFEKGIKLN